MDQSKLNQCKRIIFERCMIATLFGIVAQITPVLIFLLFINFNLLHPITWLWQTCRLMLSVYTWLYLFLLVIAAAIYGVVWSKIYYWGTSFYRNRILLFLNTLGRKTASLCTHILIGLVTAWIFIGISSWRPETTVSKESGWYLLASGIFMGGYHFVKGGMKLKHDIPFPLIQQRRFVRIRDRLYSVFAGSLRTSCKPTLLYLGTSLLVIPFMGFTLNRDSWSLSVMTEQWHNLLYVWMLASQILANINFMEELFVILLTESRSFPIEGTDLTLAAAIGADQNGIVQELACLDLYQLDSNNNALRRKQVFQLSIPGGHPYNWNAISGVALKSLDRFTKELIAAVEAVTASDKSTVNGVTAKEQQVQKGIASQMADKIVSRQMNESYGIRNMSLFQAEPPVVPQKRLFFLRSQDSEPIVNPQWLRAKVLAMSGVRYLFGDQHYERIYFTLKQYQRIIWLSQGIAALACHSISEDQYGVVQKTLPAIIGQLLELKAALDRIENVSVGRKKIKTHLKTLKSGIKRSLCRIASTFGEYINDLLLPESDRALFINYVNYK